MYIYVSVHIMHVLEQICCWFSEGVLFISTPRKSKRPHWLSTAICRHTYVLTRARTRAHVEAGARTAHQKYFSSPSSTGSHCILLKARSSVCSAVKRATSEGTISSWLQSTRNSVQKAYDRRVEMNIVKNASV